MDTARSKVGDHDAAEWVVRADGLVEDESEGCGGWDEARGYGLQDCVGVAGGEVDEAALGQEEGRRGG